MLLLSFSFTGQKVKIY